MNLDEDFFRFLEYEITKYFRKCKVPELAGFWCDGVMSSAKTSMNNNLKDSYLILRAFIGKTGQDEYDLVLKFGERSLSCINNNANFQKYFPCIENDNAFTLDFENKILEIEFQ